MQAAQFAGSKSLLSLKQTSFSASRLSLGSTISVSLKPTRDVSSKAVTLLSHIASSSKLSPMEKHNLIRLTAYIDEFGGGSRDKLFNDLAGVVTLMELASKSANYKTRTFQDAFKEYLEWREKISPSKNDEISVSLKIEVFLLEVKSSISLESPTPTPNQHPSVEGYSATV